MKQFQLQRLPIRVFKIKLAYNRNTFSYVSLRKWRILKLLENDYKNKY